MTHISELYFLRSMLEGTRIDPSSFCANQLLSAATNFAKRIVIRDLITPIVRKVSIEPNLDDRVSCFERLALTTFEQMKFCTMEGGRMC